MTCEGLAYLMFARFPYLERTRLVARGEAPPAPDFQNSIGQAHLTYIPAPLYSDDFGIQHNAQGYRGKAVSMRRAPGVLRVLFLGGSTVYGWGVSHPEETYPAQMEKTLNENLPAGIKGIEVINAGVPFATTAEMFTHYHFKFHYYQPDLVVLEAGGNDGIAFDSEFYHPDYSHWRQPLQLPQRPSFLAQKLMKSRLVSLVLIPLFYGLRPHESNLLREGAPAAKWYEPIPGSQDFPFDIPWEEMAFKHDLESLIAEIQSDHAKILLVPFRPAPDFEYNQSLKRAIDLNEQILRHISVSKNLLMVPFPAAVISPGNWLDDCHLNAAGEKEKARHVAVYAEKLLRQAEKAGENTN